MVVNQSGKVITLDVKGLAGKTSWPIDNVKKITKQHFLVFVTFLGKIADYSVSPEVYIIPSTHLEALAYHSPNGKRTVLQLSQIRKRARQFKDAWSLLI